MNSKELNFFVLRLLDLQKSVEYDFTDFLVKSAVLIKDFIATSTSSESQYFPSSFAKTLFLKQRHSLSNALVSDLRRIRNETAKPNPAKDARFSKSYVISVIKQLFESVARISIIDLRNYSYYGKTRSGTNTHKDSISESFFLIKSIGGVLKEGDFVIFEILCESENLGEITLRLDYNFAYLYEITTPGDVIFASNLAQLSGSIYKSTYLTLISLAPDFLYDASELAECFSFPGYQENLYMLKKLNDSPSSLSLVLGIVVNHIFDEIVSRPGVDFNSSYETALKTCALQLFELAIHSPQSSKLLRQKASAHYLNLLSAVNLLDEGIYTVEPTFLSPKYGLQGRLDLLIEYPDQTRKDVLELKSGKAPAHNITIRHHEKILRSGVWNNHLMQVAVYNLLLDSAYNLETGISYILYSSDKELPLRNVPNELSSKRLLLELRNKIYAQESKLARGDFSFIENLLSMNQSSVPPYSAADLIKFQDSYRKCSPVEQSYFLETSAFLMRELFASKVGSENNRGGYSKIWHSSREELIESHELMDELTLDRESSDFNAMYIVLTRNVSKESPNNFRLGDIVIMFPADKELSKLTKERLLKCTISALNSRTIRLTLRNKLINTNLLSSDKWILLHDASDSGIKKQFLLNYKLLTAKSDVRRKILGFSEPKFAELSPATKATVYKNYISQTQNDILLKAYAAEDYYLIQGPPGTGKTSFMLRALVESIYKNTDETVLLAAYTNRAVDEICKALDIISPELPYIRISSRKGNKGKNLLPDLLDEGVRLTFSRVKKCRVFAATISTLTGNTEIFRIKKFNTMIIDEASQILQPQIAGMLTMVDRFIMIGDSKQLPAIVTQNADQAVSKNELLRTYGLADFRKSLFQYLEETAIKNSWNCVGMLKWQGRMHDEIQAYPSAQFYDSKLQSLNPWQRSREKVYLTAPKNKLEKLLNENRLIFINTPISIKSKINDLEASISHQLVKSIHSLSGTLRDDLVGIISPFRAQCASIARGLPERYRELISVDTVERYQGSERQVIIISLCISKEYELANISSEYDFEGETLDRKLNVALTRAKRQLIILGNEALLRKSVHYRSLIDYIRQNGIAIDSSDGFFDIE